MRRWLRCGSSARAFTRAEGFIDLSPFVADMVVSSPGVKWIGNSTSPDTISPRSLPRSEHRASGFMAESGGLGGGMGPPARSAGGWRVAIGRRAPWIGATGVVRRRARGVDPVAVLTRKCADPTRTPVRVAPVRPSPAAVRADHPTTNGVSSCNHASVMQSTDA